MKKAIDTCLTKRAYVCPGIKAMILIPVHSHLVNASELEQGTGDNPTEAETKEENVWDKVWSRESGFSE